MGLQRITRDPWSCAGLQDGGHWHCGLCWVARHSRGDAEVYRISRFGFFNDVFLLGKKMPATRDTWPILTVADLGFFQIFSREKESAGWSDSYIYIYYIYILYIWLGNCKISFKDVQSPEGKCKGQCLRCLRSQTVQADTSCFSTQTRWNHSFWLSENTLFRLQRILESCLRIPQGTNASHIFQWFSAMVSAMVAGSSPPTATDQFPSRWNGFFSINCFLTISDPHLGYQEPGKKLAFQMSIWSDSFLKVILKVSKKVDSQTLVASFHVLSETTRPVTSDDFHGFHMVSPTSDSSLDQKSLWDGFWYRKKIPKWGNMTATCLLHSNLARISPFLVITCNMHQYASFHIDILQAKFASLAVGVPNLGATLRGKTVKNLRRSKNIPRTPPVIIPCNDLPFLDICLCSSPYYPNTIISWINHHISIYIYIHIPYDP